MAKVELSFAFGGSGGTMRLILWLVSGPALALMLAMWLGVWSGPVAVTVAVASQAVAYPLWHRRERQRLLAVLRSLRAQRGHPGTSFAYQRGEPLSALDTLVTLSIWVLAAILVAGVFIWLR